MDGWLIRQRDLGSQGLDQDTRGNGKGSGNVHLCSGVQGVSPWRGIEAAAPTIQLRSETEREMEKETGRSRESNITRRLPTLGQVLLVVFFGAVEGLGRLDLRDDRALEAARLVLTGE